MPNHFAPVAYVTFNHLQVLLGESDRVGMRQCVLASVIYALVLLNALLDSAQTL